MTGAAPALLAIAAGILILTVAALITRSGRDTRNEHARQLPPIATDGCLACATQPGEPHDWACDQVTAAQMAAALGVYHGGDLDLAEAVGVVPGSDGRDFGMSAEARRAEVARLNALLDASPDTATNP